MMMLGRVVPFFTAAVLAVPASAQFGDVLVGTQWVFETDAAHPGGTVHAALRVRLDRQYHVNSNKPDEDFLIPTVLTVTAPEGLADGFAFRWTRRWASLPLRVAGPEAVLRIRAIHPDIDREPVTVSVFWNERPVESVPLSNTDWTEVAVALGAEVGATGVLSIHVDRTWSPARAGVSEDRREFGVAFGDVAWR